MKNEKWTPNFIFHFLSQMENRKWVYIFDFYFPLAMENTKWATKKATKTTTHILVRSHDCC